MTNKNFNYDYKIKLSGKSININNESKLQELFHEINELAQDKEKNEKLTVQFRTLKKNNDFWEIIDLSLILMDLENPFLVSDKLIKEWIKSYQDYLSNAISDKDVEIEVVKVYYPLDKMNKTENIPEEGNIVQYFKKNMDRGNQTYLIMDYINGYPGENLGYSASLQNKIGKEKGDLKSSYSIINNSPTKNKLK